MAIDPVRKVAVRITPAEAGKSVLALLLARFAYRTEAAWRERLAAGDFHCNGVPAAADTVLKAGDQLEYFPRDLVEPPVRLDFQIVHEDAELLVVSKPGNLPVHPAGPYFRNTLWFALRQRYEFIHLVNRLDRETSGLLLAVKNAVAAAWYQQHLGEFVKRYFVLVHGAFPATLEATGFLGPDPGSPVRKKQRFSFAPIPDGKAVSTRFRVVERRGDLTLLEAELFTGRMHQIRATLFSLGFPVAGDKLYGLDPMLYCRQRDPGLSPADRALLRFPRQALHCALLRFPTRSGTILEFTSPLPEDLQDA